MNVFEFSIKLKASIELLAATQAEDALLTSLDLLALWKRRIQTTGQTSTGAPFAAYSTAYAKYRAKKGLQTSFFDFTVTGRGMASIRPEILSQRVGEVIIRIKASNPGDQVKLDGQEYKRGNILTPSQAEINLALDAYLRRRQKRLNDALNV